MNDRPIPAATAADVLVDPAAMRVHIRLLDDLGQPQPGHICLPSGDDAKLIATALQALTDPLVISACTPECEASRRALAAQSRELAGGAR